MLRSLRIQYPGAVYRVMARGNHGHDILQDDADRRCFLETLGEACEKTGWVVHSYVLMAERRLERALIGLGLRFHELKDLPKGPPEKVALAWWLREGTTVSLRWVSERLEMGHYTRVTKAVTQMKRGVGKNHEQLRRKLRRLG